MKGVVLTGETVVRTIMKQDYFLKHDSLPRTGSNFREEKFEISKMLCKGFT